MDAQQRLDWLSEKLSFALSTGGWLTLAGATLFGAWDLAAYGGVVHLIYRTQSK